MNSLEVSHLAELCNTVTRLIKIELGASGQVSSAANHVIVSLSRFEVENRLGNVLQQIYRTIDNHIPVRQESLSLVIRDVDGIYENSFKIWKSGC